MDTDSEENCAVEHALSNFSIRYFVIHAQQQRIIPALNSIIKWYRYWIKSENFSRVDHLMQNKYQVKMKEWIQTFKILKLKHNFQKFQILNNHETNLNLKLPIMDKNLIQSKP